MGFVLIGVLLLALKLAEVGPVAAWSWWWVLSPFPMAVAWWAWADASGFTKRRQMEKMEATKVERRRRHMENIGLGDRPPRRK